MARINFDPNSPAIALDVELKGEKQVTTKRLALDTGATFVVIPRDVAEAIGYSPELSNENITIVTASGVTKSSVITLKQVSAGGKSADNIKAIIHDLPQQSLVEGLLGLNFLKNFNLHLNFKQGFLELE